MTTLSKILHWLDTSIITVESATSILNEHQPIHWNTLKDSINNAITELVENCKDWWGRQGRITYNPCWLRQSVNDTLSDILHDWIDTTTPPAIDIANVIDVISIINLEYSCLMSKYLEGYYNDVEYIDKYVK